MSENKVFEFTGLGQELSQWIEESKNSESMDVTSIVDQLENGNIYSLTQEGIYTKLLENDLTSIENWVEKLLKPSLTLVNTCYNSHKFFLRLKKLAKKLQSLFYIHLQIAKPAIDYKYCCSKCNQNIKVKNKKYDLLSEIENHPDLSFIFNELRISPVVTNSDDLVDKCKKDSDNLQKQNCKHFESAQQNITMKNNKKVFKEREISLESASTSSSNSVSFQENDHSKYSIVKNSFISTNYLPDYIEENYVTNMLYPADLLKEVFDVQRSNLVTVQCYKPDAYSCLLCDKTYGFRNQILKHLLQPEHIAYLHDPISVELLKNYFKTFSSMKDNMCFQQGVFRLGNNMKTVACSTCRTFCPAANVIEHISGAKHKKSLSSNTNFQQYFFYSEMLQSISPNYTTNTTEVLQPQVIKSDSSKPATSKETKVINQSSNEKVVSKPNETGENKTDEKETEEIKQHNIIPSLIDNPETLFDSLQNRMKEQKKFFSWKSSVKLYCIPCKVEFMAIRDILAYHMTTVTHIKYVKDEIKKIRWFYSCDLCMITERNETRWYSHLNSAAHKQRLSALPPTNLNRNIYKEYECEPCLLVLFGNASSIEKHLQKPVQKAKKKTKEFKLTSLVERTFSSEKLLDDKISKLTSLANKTLEMHDLNEQCCQAITDAIVPEFPNCRSFPFGSRVTGIGTLDSDLDVFVDTGSMFDGLKYQDAESQANLVRLVTKVLRRHPDFTDINPIPQARTPIIQAFHKVTKIDCDLSFRHGLSVENTEFLRLCIDIQPEIRPLILILKFWMHQSYFERITTYALCMLIIFYMQTNNYLPSVKMIREIDATPSRTIAGWETFRFTKSLDEIVSKMNPCTLSTRQLMIGFFKYYIDFNYDENVICPLLGRTILKSDFDEEKGLNLPPEMQTYVDKVTKDEQEERFRHLSSICIQDPFDLSHNLTKACPKEYIQKFTTLCSHSYRLLIGCQ